MALTRSFLAACPKCGGTSGFKFYVRDEMRGDWEQDNSECINATAYIGDRVTCLDCGSKVSRSKAEGRVTP